MTAYTTIKTAWHAVMDETRNPLRHFPLMTAHMMMQILAWMWSVIFALAVGSYVVFGVTVLGHALLVAGVFATLAVFRRAEAQADPATE
ncbi:hypothetical protein [Roseovarius salinarum]|uniref:hypothetical protein n=1 Tax=Roseovarius salinarum TaxID=1981892 RepID=UPI000C344130|nr:hypothetical protein [Roseovarius salinarum]